jgi:peptidoglycan-associated lipoprotein
MRTKLLGLLAIALLVSACATDTEESGSASSEGTSMQATSSGGGGSTVSTAPTEMKTMQPAKAMEPQGLAPDSQEYLVVNVGDRVFFGFNKSEINSESADTLKRQAAWMQENGNVTVVVEGHADERGTREYNLALGERRANAVREHLISLGVSAARINTISYGKERPAVLGSNEAAWAQNRRGVTLKKGAAGS